MSKPRVILSRCFFDSVRYDGGSVKDHFVEKLKNFVEVITVCPEFDIGLGVPRPRVVVVERGGIKRLIQPDTGKDLTEAMVSYVQKTLQSLEDIDGFLLKSKSPSCGVGSTKLYRNENVIGKTDGLFAEAVKNMYPHLPVEDEGRLKDSAIRYNFLVRIFALANLRDLLKNPSPQALVNFHSSYKYLLMTYNQKALVELGRIVANGRMNLNEKLESYTQIFKAAFNRKPSRSRHVNTLLHILGHVSDNINTKEKRHILMLVERYRNGALDLIVLIEMFRALAYRFDNQYLLNQKYIYPFPDELYL